MAQLPPKAPSITQNNWHHDFSHQKNSMDQTTNNLSWVDDFLDFSSVRRGSHRRSMSDSIAFLETSMVEECRRSSSGVNNDDNDDQFDRFDDEQLMTMFTDDAAVGPTISCSNTSSPSEHNSFNDDHGPSSDQFQKMQLQQPKNEPEEVQSLCDSEGQNSNEKILDPKRIKRILANRQSAQKSRVRKLQYISELERSVNTLQAEVSVLSPRVAFLDHQRLVLNVDNNVLKQRIAALAQDKVFKDAHEEALRREIERLRQIYHQQNSKKMENSTESPTRNPETNCCSDKEQVAKLN